MTLLHKNKIRTAFQEYTGWRFKASTSLIVWIGSHAVKLKEKLLFLSASQ